MTALGTSPEAASPPPPSPERLIGDRASNDERRVLFVHDTLVRRCRPRLAGALCLLTLGVTGAVRHYRLNDELRRFGRARGAMPFPFIPCSPGLAVTTWCLGVLLWYLGAALIVATLATPFQPGGDLGVDMVPVIATSLLLFAPLWLTTLHTARRIRTTQQLVGVRPDLLLRPMRAAVLACCCFALFSWYGQRHADRAWRTWAAAQPGAPSGAPRLAPAFQWGPHR